MINGKTLTGQEAIELLTAARLIGRQVVVNAGISAAGSMPKIGVVVDPQGCFIEEENPSTALYVEVESGDDWMLYEVFKDEHFVLLSEVSNG
jgi:hypothetical protein